MINIKPIIIQHHYAAVSNLMKLLHDSEHEMFDKTAPWTEIETSYMRHCIEMQEECDGTFLMAWHGDKPVGFIFGYAEEQDDSRIETYTGLELYVSDGFVLPDYRRQGIYKQLNELLEKIYMAKGVKRITRYAQSANNRMHGFLQGAGYISTRVLFEKWL